MDWKTGDKRPRDASTPTTAANRRSDYHVDPVGAKGIGEIHITGSAAAVVNAVFHAPGKRVSDLPITLDKLL